MWDICWDIIACGGFTKFAYAVMTVLDSCGSNFGMGNGNGSDSVFFLYFLAFFYCTPLSSPMATAKAVPKTTAPHARGL